VDVALACEDGLALEHLTEDAAGAPHVYRRCVSPQLEEQLRWPVPSSHNQACVLPACFAVAPASLGHRLVVVSRETEISNLESPAIVDEQVGCLHISMEDVVVVEVAEALEQLQHVAFDLRLQELHIGVVEKARQIVIHVRCDHVEYRALPALSLGPLYCHLFQSQDIVVRQHLEQLDLSQRGDGEAVFFVVHQDLLHRVDAAGDSMARFVHFTKSSLAQLLKHFVFADLGAALEAVLQTLLGCRVRRCCHGGGGCACVALDGRRPKQ
jgi:hypothetical protein